MNTHIFLQTPARLLAETTEFDKSCSCCGRRDHDPPLQPPPSSSPSPSARSLARYLPWLGREFKRFGELPFNLLRALTTPGAAVVASARDRRVLRRAN